MSGSGCSTSADYCDTFGAPSPFAGCARGPTKWGATSRWLIGATPVLIGISGGEPLLAHYLIGSMSAACSGRRSRAAAGAGEPVSCGRANPARPERPSVPTGPAPTARESFKGPPRPRPSRPRDKTREALNLHWACWCRKSV